MSAPTLPQVRAALTLTAFDSRAAQGHMAPSERPFSAPRENVRRAAVLIVLYPQHETAATDSVLAFPLIRRAEYPGVHSGQMSLPGGRLEADEQPEQAALRETCEEIGICSGVTLIGSLSRLYVPPSNFEIWPLVGWYNDQPRWQPDVREVDQVFSIPLAALLDDSSKRHDEREFMAGRRMRLPYYLLADQVVWGATAIILSELEQRLRLVMG